MTKRELSPSIDGPQLEETLPSPSRPGILTVILRGGTGLSVPDGYIDGEQSKPNLPYAILDYDKSQKQADSCEGTAQNPVWVPDSDRFPYGPAQQDEDTGYYHAPNWQFDVCRPAELAIYLYLRDLHTPSSMRSQDSFLGVARIAIDPSRVSGISSQWLDVQHGTGQLRISLEYKDMRDQVLEKADFDDRFLYRLMKKDTRQRYFPRTIPVVQQPQNVNHPFLAPFTLTFQSQEGLKLLSPTINGGHLFHHLQRQQCFNLESARFYAAEILCALEYLHNTRGIYSWLKPRNVILDSFGHVVLCGSGIFKPGIDGDRSSYGMPEYPSPEVLLNQGEFRAADWWTLGIFIFEMLIGLPLFFDENTDEIRRKILGPGPIQVSEMLPPVARDIITRLLEREPGHRLGAKVGASEVKEHPFFAGIDWAMLLQRNYEPPFKPDFGLRHRDFRKFTQHPTQEHLQQTYKPLEKHLDFGYLMGTLLKDLEPESNLGLESDDEAALTPESSQEGSVQETDNKGDDGWELVWEEGAPGELYFRHRTTGDKKPIPARADVSSNRTNEAAAAAAAAARNGGPSTSQKQDALEAALQAGHDHIISQIISFGIDLNVDLFGYKSISPLEWSVDQKKLSLVQLMLDNGADVRVSRVKPLLVRAVATGDRKLVELLLQRSMGRVDLTRALRLAVDRRDCVMAQLLLAHGAQCDFKDEDRPLPEVPLPGVIDCCFDRISWSEWLEEFMPPLVRAVKLGDVGLVRLLLRNGANANIGYFGLYSDLMEKRINFSSGRVIQLAMELGRPETIKLLLAAGADISLAQPVWRVPGHSHWDVSRAIYQETMSKLRAVVATAGET